MATAAASPVDDDTECSVCHELFTEPKLLPCAHILCRHCLLSWLDSNPDALCPLCRAAIADPNRKRPSGGWQEVVDALPTDVTMAALVKSTRILSQGQVCGGCQSAADIICLNCSDMMCTSCSKAHKNFSATRSHKIEDLSTMTAEQLAASQPDYCDVHSNKPSELFCPTHGVAICHLCASAKHRACSDLTELTDSAEKSREELKELATSLLKGEEDLDKALSELERHLEDTEKAMQKAVAEIDATCNRLENSVKACRRRLKELAIDAQTKVNESVQAVKTIFLSRRGKLTSHRRIADRVKEPSTDKSICHVTSTLKSRVKDLDFTSSLPQDAEVVSMIAFVMESDAIARIEKELNDLGQMSLPSSASVSSQVNWYFHTNHGGNIKLSNDGLTAERVRGDKDGIVVSNQPVVINWLYEVKTETSDVCHYFPCGVVLTEPDTLSLPVTAHYGWNSAIVISKSVFNRGQKVVSKLQAGPSLKVGTQVGVMLDTKGDLHYYQDGKDQGVIVSGVTTPCYAFWELRKSCTEITALPPTFLG